MRPSVHLVLDADVWEVDPLVEVRQVVFARPALDFTGISTRPAVAVRPPPVVLLEEALVLPLQLLLEQHAPDVRVSVAQAPLGAAVGPVDLRVVRQLPRPADARVERLPAILGTVPAVRFQQVRGRASSARPPVRARPETPCGSGRRVGGVAGRNSVSRTRRRPGRAGPAPARHGTRPPWPACAPRGRRSRRRDPGREPAPARGRVAGRDAAGAHRPGRCGHAPANHARGGMDRATPHSDRAGHPIEDRGCPTHATSPPSRTAQSMS